MLEKTSSKENNFGMQTSKVFKPTNGFSHFPSNQIDAKRRRAQCLRAKKNGTKATTLASSEQRPRVEHTSAFATARTSQSEQYIERSPAPWSPKRACRGDGAARPLTPNTTLNRRSLIAGDSIYIIFTSNFDSHFPRMNNIPHSAGAIMIIKLKYSLLS